MPSFLIIARGFIGDTLFASSIAKKLHEQHGRVNVDFVTPLIQPLLLLRENPYIREVYVGEVPDGKYDHRIELGLVDQSEPATIQFQRTAGIINPSLEFDVYTVPEYDDETVPQMVELRKTVQRPIVAFQSNWWEKSYRFTEAQYNAGIDHGHGFGDGHRHIKPMLDFLSKHIALVEVGLPAEFHQRTARAADPVRYAATASLIKHCDWMIGAESGLTNLSAAVGTKTIITTDFIWQQYGPNGNFKKLAAPAMGPKTYYPDAGHVHLDPFLTDEEVAIEILNAIGIHV